jgi:TRIAP1/MDM35 family protein
LKEKFSTKSLILVQFYFVYLAKFIMNSIDKKCQEAKEKYDACFNHWFSEKYLKGQYDDECEPLFRTYQKCVKEAIAGLKIELWNLPSEYEPAHKKNFKNVFEEDKKKS